MELIHSFKEKFIVPTKDFKDTMLSELTVNLVKDRDGKVMFEVKIPDYIYEKALVTEMREPRGRMNTAEKPEIMKMDNFKRLSRSPFLEGVKDYIHHISNEIVMSETKEENFGDKVIFIKFKGNVNNIRGGSYVGVNTGEQINISFQFFVGYKYEGVRKDLLCGERHEVKLYGYYKFNKLGANMHSEGDILPINQYSKDDEQMMRDFIIIPYTEEREEYLKKVQNDFIKLTEYLNSYLNNIDIDKLDKLIASSDTSSMTKLIVK